MLKDLTKEELGLLTSRILLDGLTFTSENAEEDTDEAPIIASLVKKGYVKEVNQTNFPYYSINLSQLNLFNLLTVNCRPMAAVS